MMTKFDRMFLNAYFNREKPSYKNTFEVVGFEIARRSLSKEDTKNYLLYSGIANPIFFHLSLDELNEIELSIPPYQSIVENIHRKLGITEEDLKFSKKFSKKHYLISKLISYFNKDWKKFEEASKKVNEKILTEEFKEVLLERSKMSFKNFIKKFSFIPYGLTSSLIYLRATDPTILAAYLLSILANNLLSYCTLKTSSKFFKQVYLPSSFAIPALTGSYIASRNLDPVIIGSYFLTYSLPYYYVLKYEYKAGTSLLEHAINKSWKYLPKSVRKAIDESEKFLSGIKLKPFDEREMRRELYEASQRIKNITALSSHIDKFREDLENNFIEIKDARKELYLPFSLGYTARKIVLIKEGREWKIMDKEYIKRISQGEFLESFENKVLKEPWKYLKFDIFNRKPVYSRNIIVLYYFENEGLMRGVASKEVESTLLLEHGHFLSLVYKLYINYR